MARNEAYTAARLASEELLRRDIQAADAIAGATIASADAAWRKRNCAAAEKDAAYAMAADNRAAAYAEAEQRHRDRLAAIQRHFGQQVTCHGNPDAGHAQAFVETVADPKGQFAPVPVEAPIGAVVAIDYNGIKRQVRVDARGRVVAESPIADDGWSRRGTFAGDAEAFMAAKRAGVGLKSDPDEPPPAPPVPPPPMIRGFSPISRLD